MALTFKNDVLKTFKNEEEWCFVFWNIFPRFRDIQVFVQKLLTSQTERMTVINHKISENIGWVMFKRGTSNLNQIRHKVTTIKILPYQHTGFQSLYVLTKISRILNR